jgi:hypothetical protein
MRQAHQAKSQGRHSWAILTQFVEGDRLASHIDARTGAIMDEGRSKDYQLLSYMLQQQTGLWIL